MSNAAAVDRLRDAALERFGRVNLVCNNVGVAGSMAGAEIDLDDLALDDRRQPVGSGQRAPLVSAALLDRDDGQHGVDGRPLPRPQRLLGEQVGGRAITERLPYDDAVVDERF